MTPEVKAAIEKMAEVHADKGFERNVMDAWALMEHDFKAGAEYGYKLAEEKLEIAVKALKELIANEGQGTEGNEHWDNARETLKELGEI